MTKIVNLGRIEETTVECEGYAFRATYTHASSTLSVTPTDPDLQHWTNSTVQDAPGWRMMARRLAKEIVAGIKR